MRRWTLIAVVLVVLLTTSFPLGEAQADMDCPAIADLTPIGAVTIPEECSSAPLIVDGMALPIPEAGDTVKVVALVEDNASTVSTRTWSLAHSHAGRLSLSKNVVRPSASAEAFEPLSPEADSAHLAPLAVIPSWCGNWAYAFNGKKWSSKTYSYHFTFEGGPAGASPSAIADTLKAAGDIMTASSSVCVTDSGAQNSLRIIRSTNATLDPAWGNGINDVHFKNISGTATLAQCTWNMEGSLFTEADIFFNTAKPWHYTTASIPDTTKYDLMSLAAHEFGHCVGLSHYETLPKQIMYPSYVKGESRRVKRQGDARAIGHLYPVS